MMLFLWWWCFFWWHPETPKDQGFARARQASGLDFVSEDTEAYPILDGASIDNELHWNWRIWFLGQCLLVVQIRSVSPQTWKSDPQKQPLANSPVARHVRSIGVGSFGSVRMVEHVKTSARYALKRIKKVNGKALRFIGWSWEGWGEAGKVSIDTPSALLQVPEEVQEECKLLATVSHPFVLQMVKSFEILSV